jgi:ATP-dependent RNA helicase DeaD
MNETISEVLTFSDLGLSQNVLDAVLKIGYETPSPIQAEAIPLLLQGKNLLGTAQTGTGKTAAFALPLLSRLDEKQKAPQILVMTPTRELAIQVAEAIQKYASHIPEFHVLPVYGGQDIAIQFRALKRRVHVIVGTPGRVTDHLRRDSLDLSQLKAIVLDEADEMLKMGFEEDIRGILGKTSKECQRAFFSATMPHNLQSIIKEHLGQYEEIRIQNKTATVEKVCQRFVMVRNDHKLDALTRILEHEAYDAMLIFVRTKISAAELAEKLEARGYAATPLSGDLNQALRERTINRLKEGLVDIVVATDVAARGLDVDRITHVTNYDVPYDTESYVHRIGRTGRAGREGNAILFITPRERSMLKSIERATRQPITPMDLPTNEQIQDKRVLEFKTKLLETVQKEDLNKFSLLVESWADEESVEMRELASALLMMAQKDAPLFEKLKEVPKSFDRPDSRDGRDNRFERNDRPDRFAREDRPERGDRPMRAPRDDSDPFKAEEGFDRYYIGVGREHRIQPGDIVGAIANESGLESKNIGRIKLFPFFSTVELPVGMPKEIMDILRDMSIRGNPSKFRLMTDEAPPARDRGEDRGPRNFGGGDDRGPRNFGGGGGFNRDRAPRPAGDNFNREGNENWNHRDSQGNFPKRGGFGGGFGGGRKFGGGSKPGFGGRGK